jgi:hypothetical protein
MTSALYDDLEDLMLFPTEEVKHIATDLKKLSNDLDDYKETMQEATQNIHDFDCTDMPMTFKDMKQQFGKDQYKQVLEEFKPHARDATKSYLEVLAKLHEIQRALNDTNVPKILASARMILEYHAGDLPWSDDVQHLLDKYDGQEEDDEDSDSDDVSKKRCRTDDDADDEPAFKRQK